MYEKENRIPLKQGVMYELNLNKSQGPYLPKDIMHTNPKSIALLAGSHIVNSFSSLNRTLKITETKQKQYDTTLSSIESFGTLIKGLEDEIQRNVKCDNKLKIEQAKLRNEFYVLNDSIHESNSQLLDQYLPLLKGLHKLVREQASYQKQQTFRLERQIKGMIQSKKQLLQGVFKCQQKILAIQGCFGTSSQETWQTQQ